MTTTKVQPVKIEFPFSEAPHVAGTFKGPDCWALAQHQLTLSPRPSLGYYKTDFVITYEDGFTYSGRYDIGADSPTLEGHVIDHLRYHGDVTKFLDRYHVGR
jgi:hypothetical protein